MSISHKGDDQDIKLLELRSNYWLKRLDHTLTHTQSSSRLIYIVDGAVLALLYFTIQNVQPTRRIILLAAFPTLLLAILNFLHARLIDIQQSWYSGIDYKLREILGQEPVKHQAMSNCLASTHRIYRTIHIVIAIFLIIASIAMFLYGCGYFSEITIKLLRSLLHSDLHIIAVDLRILNFPILKKASTIIRSLPV